MKTRKFINLRGPDGILDITGKSVSTIRRWELKGYFPRRHYLGPSSVAWASDEVATWLENPQSWANNHKAGPR